MKTKNASLLAALATLFLVSCESPAPIIISNPMPSPAAPLSNAPRSSVTAPSAPLTYAYPNIAGAWKCPYATMAIGPSNGPSFILSVNNPGGKANAFTAHWGQPYHRHFTFKRANGTQARATLKSLNPTSISVEEEDGRIREWVRR